MNSRMLSILLVFFSVLAPCDNALAFSSDTAIKNQQSRAPSQDVDLQATPNVESNWGSGYTANITIHNSHNTTLASWRAQFTLAAGQSIENIWNAKLASNQPSTNVTAINEPWNGSLAPGQSATFGYQVKNPQNTNAMPSALVAVGSTSASSQPPMPTSTILASYGIDNRWNTGYQVTVTLKNNAPSPTTSWQASFDLPQGQSVSSMWNAVYTASDSKVMVNNPQWSGGGVIPANGTTTFGMIISNPTSSPAELSNLQASANGGDTPQPPMPTPPQTPMLANISVNPSTPRDYTVSWNAVNNATSYTLQQSNSNSFSSPITVAQGNILLHSLTNQANGTYYYRVSASNNSGMSPWSNTQQVTVSDTPVSLNTPVLQSINNPSGAMQFQVSWSSVNNAQGYKLEQSKSSDFANPSTVFNGNATSAQVSVSAAGTYYYRVRAFAGSSTSAPSNVVSTMVNQTNPPLPSSGPIIDGYWESWYVTRDGISNILALKSDVLNISFGNFTSLGNHTYEVGGVEASLAEVKQFISMAHSMNKKVKIAIGGIGYPIIHQLKTDQDAMGMAKAVAKYVIDMQLEGVDYDIEDFTPAPLELALLKYTRQELPNHLITYTPMSPAYATTPFKEVIRDGHQYMDYISIMAYNNYPGYSYKEDAQELMKMGVPASKIVIGLMPGSDDVGAQTSVAAIREAAEYIKQAGLKGIMFWSLNRDYTNATGLGKNAATDAAWSVFHP